MSAFSDFFTKATPKEKELVYNKVIQDSINDQRSIMGRFKTLDDAYRAMRILFRNCDGTRDYVKVDRMAITHLIRDTWDSSNKAAYNEKENKEEEK